MPKVSVIIPTFNRKNMLKEAIDSILAQTYSDFELIIVDNCSTDGTERMVAGYHDERIRYFRNSNNGIIAVNLNYGIKRARGEYIALCDDDDIWMPDKLSKQVASLDAEPSIALGSTNAIDFDEKGDHGVHFSDTGDRYISSTAILYKNPIVQSSVLLRRSALDKTGLFSEDPAYFSVEEFELWLRLFKSYKGIVLAEPLMKYRTHSGVHRTQGLDHLNRLKCVVDDLHKKGVIGFSVYSKFTVKYYA